MSSTYELKNGVTVTERSSEFVIEVVKRYVIPADGLVELAAALVNIASYNMSPRELRDSTRKHFGDTVEAPWEAHGSGS